MKTKPAMPPAHPGEMLREDVLPALGISISACARALGVSRQMLHRILAGTHSITPEMALRIGKFVGNGPEIWLSMQQAYDLWHAQQDIAPELALIKRYPKAA
ncbi:MAG: HigA family addiction module antitoxin [Gammaproteobacteria bacterium]